MASFNRVILLGNITRDIEIKYLPSGMAVAEIGLAVNDRRKNQAGEWVEETTFVDVTLWGRTAEVAGEYLSKGSPVLIEGRLKLDTWETDGQKRSKLRVTCEKMQMIGGRGGGPGDGGGPSGGGASRGGSNRGGGARGGGRSAPQHDESEFGGDFDDSGPNYGGGNSGGRSRGAQQDSTPENDIPF